MGAREKVARPPLYLSWGTALSEMIRADDFRRKTEG